MKISVFGLGYVGAVCSACLAESGHEVLGVDPVSAKVDDINQGRAPILEPGIAERIAAGREAGRLRATVSAAEAVSATDVSLICVGTPSQANGSLDLRHVRQVAAEIGDALRDSDEPHLVVLRSTVLPGTTEEVLLPILEKHSERRVGDGLAVAMNPEFMREATAVHDFYHPPKIVVGASDEAAARTVDVLYQGIQATRVHTTIRVAEMVKYADNAFHAVKVTFANEVGAIAKALGIDGREVMSIFCQDRKLNLSEAYLKPGFAFGGSCLPKDLRAITYQARRMDLESPLLGSLIESNDDQVAQVVRWVVERGSRRVGFVGMSFKALTDDLRESPLVRVMEALIGKGYSVRIHDPDVALSRLVGANRVFMEEHLPHLSSLLEDDLDALFAGSDVLVIGHAMPEVLPRLAKARADQHVLDLACIAKQVDTPAHYEGICW